MNAEIVAIGSELLLGQVVDTNSAWMAQRLARRRRYDVLIALGVVIRGKTHHFELVTRECARGIMQVSLAHDLPVVFEVIAAYNRRDAQRRAGPDRFNRGLEAAQTALSLLRNVS